jgi:hypothetical protein
LRLRSAAEAAKRRADTYARTPSTGSGAPRSIALPPMITSTVAYTGMTRLAKTVLYSGFSHGASGC